MEESAQAIVTFAVTQRKARKRMIVEYDETYFSVKLYHSIYDTKPYKVIGIEDLVSLWLEKESEEEE